MLVLPVYIGRSLEIVLRKDISRQENNRTRYTRFFSILIHDIACKHVDFIMTAFECSIYSFFYYNYHEIGSGNGMGGLLIDKLYSPREVIISDMESHMSHINHNIELNSGESNNSKLKILDGILRNLSKSLKKDSVHT